MLDLQQIATDHIKKLEQTGVIKTAIEKGIETAIIKAIDNQFGHFGSFSKQVEEVIKAGLKIDPDQIDFQVYNHQITTLIKQRLGNMFEGRSRDRFLEELEGILEPAPEEIDIACLIKEVVRLWGDEQASFYDDNVSEYATVTLEKRDWGEDSHTLTIDNGSGRLSGCKGVIELYLTGGKIGISHRMETNPTVLFRSADAYIFKLYAAGTKVVGVDAYDPEDHEDDFLIHDGEGHCSC